MLQYYKISLMLCVLLLVGCDERPSERRAWREERESRKKQGALVETRQIKSGKETALRLDLEYNGGYLTVERELSGLLADVTLEFDREENRPLIDYDSSSASPTLRIRSPRKQHDELSFNRFRGNDWRIKLSPKIPIEIRINGGAIDGRLNFTTLRLADLDVNVGAGELWLEFRERNSERPRLRLNSGAAETVAKGLCNANFRRLEFNGGVGTSRLSFDGEWKNEAPVELNLGVGKNTVLLPQHVGVKIHESGSFLAPISMHGFEKRGGLHYSKNYDQATGHLDFDIKMGIGHTSIDWLD
ncbi:MAG: toast rack family protein [candidate division KSB1 bacterium]|nr:toast rack family protein [candidate division KSB1 bacterium]MDZ7303155.1 toast rack family protein [candidate division KSB1 bacterium]MDZ7310135.1 toast rack family protein [candidate division KSB1 bacterium]